MLQTCKYLKNIHGIVLYGIPYMVEYLFEVSGPIIEGDF